MSREGLQTRIKKTAGATQHLINPCKIRRMLTIKKTTRMICVAATRLYANMVGPIITKRTTPNNTACRTEQQNVQAQTDNTACHHTPRPPPILHDTTLEQYNLRQTLQLGTPARNDQGRGRVSVQFVEARDAFACLEQPLLHTGVLHIQRGVVWTMRRYTIKKVRNPYREMPSRDTDKKYAVHKSTQSQQLWERGKSIDSRHRRIIVVRWVGLRQHGWVGGWVGGWLERPR